ncbi:hypothetical protein K440DRAFT_611840 [Wilcoxina mikolae CBS 423.85]|nr:hypothetical protein K440DRAFT_611840 [Wilcoxina mikolae CBS 423.85]
MTVAGCTGHPIGAMDLLWPRPLLMQFAYLSRVLSLVIKLGYFGFPFLFGLKNYPRAVIITAPANQPSYLTRNISARLHLARCRSWVNCNTCSSVGSKMRVVRRPHRPGYRLFPPACRLYVCPVQEQTIGSCNVVMSPDFGESE